MATLAKKTLKTSRSLTYTYYVSSATSGLATVLLCHGWPDSAALWSGLITDYLQPAGYGVIAIDCLGYAGTDKPTDTKSYAWDGMTKDLCDILDAEKVGKVVSLGHDWGSSLAQRMWLFHPERVLGLCIMNVPYNAPSEKPLDLGEYEKVMVGAVGYFPFWYWYLFSSDEGPEILDGHLDSLFTALHGPGVSMYETFAKKDGLKDWLLHDRKQEVLSYATDDMRKKFVERFSKDGFESPLCWYRAIVDNTQHRAEKDLPAARHTVEVPTLFIGGAEDKVCLTAGIHLPKEQGLLPDLTVVDILGAPHWCMLVKPKEVGEALTNWLKDKF